MADLAANPGVSPAAAPARTPASSTRVDRASRERVWRAAWWPFWVWSDVPAPEWPHREAPLPSPLGLAGEAFLGGLDAVRRRMWIRHALHGIVRGLWLALMLAAVWVAIALPTGWSLPELRALLVMGAVALALGIAFAAVSYPSRRRTARMLDRTFGLQERLTTAYGDLGRGVPGPNERAPLVYLQMADAANAMDAVRASRALRVKAPIREVVLAVFWGLVLAALVFLRGVGGGMPPLVAASVPDFSPAAEQPEPEPPVVPAALPEDGGPTIEDVLARADRSNQARKDLQELASALADHAVTRPAADAIGRGDYEAAADSLRSLAPDSPQISETERGAMANDLRSASEEMSADGDGLRQASQEAASGLEQGDRAAQDGLRHLAEAVEQTGEQVAPQGDLAEQMRQAQQGNRRAAQNRQQDPNAAQPGAEQAESAQSDQSGQPSESGDAGDPGQGADASGEPGQPGGEPGDRGQPGEGQPGSGQPGEQGGESGQGDGEAGVQPGDGEQGGSGEPGAEDAAAGGGAAGAGSDSTEQANESAASGAEQGDQPATGEAAEQRVSEGDGAGADPGDLAPVTEAIALPPGSGGQRGVQTASDGGGALAGAGAGVTAGSGSAVQGEVGEAGPDSNHVPAQHRDLVETYFTLPEGP